MWKEEEGGGRGGGTLVSQLGVEEREEGETH